MRDNKPTKREVYEIVTDRIIERMEQGAIPWERPWNSAIGLPRNIQGRQYRGINVWILGAQGYESPVWLTFRQAKEMGGHVKAGEKSTPVVFWKLLGRDKEEPDGSISHKVFPLMRYYNVFNLEQCADLPVKANDTVSPFADRKPIEAAETIIAGMPLRPEIRETRHDEGKPPYYSSHLDYVDMPLKSQFPMLENWYSVLFHELGHSTGHPDRLNRKSLIEYGDVPGAQSGRARGGIHQRLSLRRSWYPRYSALREQGRVHSILAASNQGRPQDADRWCRSSTKGR